MSVNKITEVRHRFRGFLPIIVDVETAGFDAKKDALLEVAAVIPGFDEDKRWTALETHSCHIEPFEGANLDPAALAFNGIDPYHPFRMAVSEKEGLTQIFQAVRAALKETSCTRAILVGHNAAFDLGFLNEAVKRSGVKRNPFHPFSCFDTATLCGLSYGQTVLAKAAKAAGMKWDNEAAHSAIYDAEQTAELFCRMVNLWDDNIGIPAFEIQT